jgi:hypothetical protein
MVASWPNLFRPSTSFDSDKKDFVDDGVKPGHDDFDVTPLTAQALAGGASLSRSCSRTGFMPWVTFTLVIASEAKQSRSVEIASSLRSSQ